MKIVLIAVRYTFEKIFPLVLLNIAQLTVNHTNCQIYSRPNSLSAVLTIVAVSPSPLSSLVTTGYTHFQSSTFAKLVTSYELTIMI